jgi:uncharacterized membrane protein
MESKVKLFVDLIHPMLVVFPLGLLIMVVIILYLISKDASFAVAAYSDIAATIIGGLLAAVFGLLNWLAIPGGMRAKRVGHLHGGGNVIVVPLFAVSWLMRAGDPNRLPTTTALILALVGDGLGAITGWLGGELVDRLGVGVDRDANLNAPNSLSGQPAGTT